MTRPALAGSQCLEMLGSIFFGRGGADFLLAVVAAEPLETDLSIWPRRLVGRLGRFVPGSSLRSRRGVSRGKA